MNTERSNATRATQAISYQEAIDSLYIGIMDRRADQGGLHSYVAALSNGEPLSGIIKKMLASQEFRSRQSPPLTERILLPDLTQLYPTKYVRKGNTGSIFHASSDEDFRLLESLITKNRYYDSLGVWAPTIDLDKRLTAAIVQGLGARSCVEMGCFTGPVLSLLADQGVDVCGVEISHLAFVLAYANIFEKIRFGTLLDVNFDRKFDVFLGMDVLEHVSPLELDHYVARISELVRSNGFAYINSPMFGNDDIFGNVFDVYLPEWHTAGEDVLWRHLHCDEKGWPMHGHLVWASPKWWERTFFQHGLVRDRDVERVIQVLLSRFFEKRAPARRSLFVLRHPDFRPDVDYISRNLHSKLSPLVATLT